MPQSRTRALRCSPKKLGAIWASQSEKSACRHSPFCQRHFRCKSGWKRPPGTKSALNEVRCPAKLCLRGHHPATACSYISNQVFVCIFLFFLIFDLPLHVARHVFVFRPLSPQRKHVVPGLLEKKEARSFSSTSTSSHGFRRCLLRLVAANAMCRTSLRNLTVAQVARSLSIKNDFTRAKKTSTM